MTKRIGKIQSVAFGMGGYDDAMLGLTVTLGSDKDSWGVGDFKGTWACEPGKYTKWTLQDQTEHWGTMVRWIGELLAAAKVSTVSDLKGIPVEVTFDDNLLKSWRILTEAI